MFEWDEAKRLANISKHDLDFRDAATVFDGRPVVHIPALHPGEARIISVAAIGAKFYAVVWTWRGGIRRIISFRRAHHGEEKSYRKIHG